jgi:outer membrane cobalamin receptor
MTVPHAYPSSLLVRALSCGAAILVWSSLAAAAAAYAGRPLGEVLRELAAGGLRLVYNDQVVTPRMHVTSEPVARSGVALLDELLAPHGLTARRVGDDAYAIVVAAPRASDPPLAAVEPPAPLEQIVVASSRYTLRESTPTVTTFLSQAEVESMPRLAEDTLKIVQRLPGAASNGIEGLAHMRGGEENETLIVLDGLPLYEPFHLRMLQSPTSLLDPRVVDGLDVHVGGFSAEFGDRMSTVIEAHSVRPETNHHYELGASLFHTNGLAAHDFADGRGQWLVAARRSNLDEIAHLTDFERGEPHYGDGFGRVDYVLADGTRLALHALASADSLKLTSSDDTEFSRADYRNMYVWGSLEHTWSPAFDGRLVISHTDVTADRRGAVEDPGRRFGEVDDERSYHVSGLRADFNWLAGRFLNRFGAEVRSLSANYQYESDVTFAAGYPYPDSPQTSLTRNIRTRPEGEHVSAYFTSRVQLGERLTAEAGLRWDEQTYVEDADSQFGPRLNLVYELDDATRLRASWGRYQQAQGIDELQVQDGVDEFSRAQYADHLIVGFERGFAYDWLLRAEAYQKTYDDLKPRYENLFDPLSLVPELRGDRVRIAPDGAQARGIELLIARRSTQPWNGWLSYTWSEVQDEIDGNEVLRSWDQTHTVGFGVTWTRAAWDAALAFTYHTGWPTTSVRLAEPDGSSPDVTIGTRNGDRVAAFASLDLRVARSFELKRGKLSVHAEVTNALNRANPCCVDYGVVERDGTWELTRDEQNWLPVVPSIGVLWTF